jgi:predicted nucleic acid-binding protein
MKRLLLDANVMIRFLRADHPDHFERAKKLFEQAESGDVRLVLLDAVLAEVVFVLTSVYEVRRADIADNLRPFLFHSGIECPGSKVLDDALGRFVAKSVDFLDAYIAAQALAMEVPVSTFDKDFRKFKDIKFEAP